MTCECAARVDELQRMVNYLREAFQRIIAEGHPPTCVKTQAGAKVMVSCSCAMLVAESALLKSNGGIIVDE